MNPSIFLALAVVLFTSAIAGNDSSTPSVQQSSRQTFTEPNPLCTGFCYTSIAGRRQAELACQGKKGCAVTACSSESFGEGKEGFSCVPAPASPITEGPITIPSLLQFPEDIVIGGTVDVEVTVTVDDVSSATREDFYLLSDATGSMSAEIAQTKKDFQKLVDSRTSTSQDVAFGVGYYRDEEDVPPFDNLQRITKDFSLVRAAIDKLQARGGADFPEANLYALSQVATAKKVGWREGTRKILVYFGDAPGHEPTCPAGSELTRGKIIKQLNDKGIAVIATNFGSSNSGLNAATKSAEGPKFGCGLNADTKSGQATDIVEGTNGALKLATDPKMLIDIILEAVQGLDQELSVVTTDCAGKVDIEFSPDLPLLIASGESKTIFEKATILPGACEFPDGFKCEIDLFLSGVGVKQVIQTTTIAGCEKDGGLFP